ncbi:MAG: alpha/beta fold hydrolase [Geminicoccaceae bacterium]|nr:MAG: alpha/beta fold hydrolase [Geminicoccaceae bacterium]
MKLRPSFCVALLALGIIGLALVQLFRADAGLVVERLAIEGTPATLFRKADAPPGPVVLIAHGFAGSQQLMRPFAVTLAQNGYTALTFDFLGHGRHPAPLGGSITEETGATRYLVAQVEQLLEAARVLPAGDGQLALLGHSMASDIIIRAAQANPDVAATIAVSMFSPAVDAESPRNLLVIVGDWEAGLKREALRVVQMVTDEPALAGVTYGDHGEGTARRAAWAPHAEHVAVLYSETSMAEALAWLDATFERTSEGQLDVRGYWIALLLLGIVTLAWPLSKRLPEVAPLPTGDDLPRRTFLALAILPALLTPPLLRFVPTDFLPILVGDYLAVHFGVYGLLTALGLWWVGRSRPARHQGTSLTKLALAATLTALYAVLALGLPLDRFFTAYLPIPERWPLVAAMALGMFPFFLADEFLTRGTKGRYGRYAFTKLCFLLSLGFAVALDFERLFFLLIIVPVIIPCFVVYGLLSEWAYRRTHHPAPGGIANALAFAWAIAVTFPLLGG